MAFITGDTDSQYFIPRSALSVFSCDINSDNSNDIIVGHIRSWTGTNPTISVLKNNGDGIFSISDTSISFSGGVYGNIYATQINNDTSPDIVTTYIDWSTGVERNFVRVFYNDGSGNFTTFLDFNINSPDFYDEIASGDFNGDSHRMSSLLKIFLKTGELCITTDWGIYLLLYILI